MNPDTMPRTAVTLRPELFRRLRDFASKRGKTMSEIIEDSVRPVIYQNQEPQIRHMYRVLRELAGIGGKGISDASTTMNDLLYGEQGAWKGRSE